MWTILLRREVPQPRSAPNKPSHRASQAPLLALDQTTCSRFALNKISSLSLAGSACSSCSISLAFALTQNILELETLPKPQTEEGFEPPLANQIDIQNKF